MDKLADELSKAVGDHVDASITTVEVGNKYWRYSKLRKPCVVVEAHKGKFNWSSVYDNKSQINLAAVSKQISSSFARMEVING